MAASNKDLGTKTEKLETVIKRSDLIIGMLEKKGVDTKKHKNSISSARENLDQGKIEDAFRIAMECIGDLKKLKAKHNGNEGRIKDRRGKGVFALIRDNTADMQKKLDEWKVIINGWRNKGYQFERDESLFSRSFDVIEKRFISIGEQIEKAEQIRGRISRYREEFPHVGKSYLKKIDDIEKAVFRLDRLDDLERRLKSVVSNIRSVEGRYKALRNRINRYRRKGLNTSSLEEMLENDEDLDYLDKQFNIYESNVDFLLKEKNKLKSLKNEIKGNRFEKKVEDLERIIDDPWMLDQVVERMLDLEKSIKEAKEKDKKMEEEKKRRQEIKRSLERYSSEGFKVEMVEQLLDEDINLLEEEYDIFIKQTARLKSLKEKLFKLDATGFEEDVSRISQKLYDPTNLDQIETELKELKDRIFNQRIRSQKIENAIKEWSGMGFKVNKLEDLLETDMDRAEELYNIYRERIAELTDYEQRIKEMNPRDVQDHIHRINLKIKNPELIESVRKEMERLQADATDAEKIRAKRAELNTLLKTWKSQGYQIDRILEDTKKESTIEGLERVILDYTRAIASLESFKNELPTYERGWFPLWEKEIRDHMNDPMKAKETLKKFTKLKSLINKEEKRRGEISRKLNELSNRGIDVSRLSALLTGEAKTLNAEYETFKQKVTRLLKLKAKLLKEAHGKGDQELEMFAKGMNDPYQIDYYEHQIEKKDQVKNGKGSVEEIDRELESMKKRAKELFRSDKLDEALELFEKILEIDPTNKESNFYRKKVKQKIKTEKRKAPEEKKAPMNGDQGGPDSPEMDEKEGASNAGDEESSKQGGDPNCLSCKGTGECVWCNGKGVCSTCNGTGKTFGDKCPTCKGDGKCSVCKGSGKCSWCNI